MRNALVPHALYPLVLQVTAAVVQARRSHTDQAGQHGVSPLTLHVGCSAGCLSPSWPPPQHTRVAPAHAGTTASIAAATMAWLPQTAAEGEGAQARPSARQCAVSADEVDAVVVRALERNEWQRAVALFRGALRLACVPRAETYTALLRGVLRAAGVVSACKLTDVLATSRQHRAALYAQLVACAAEAADGEAGVAVSSMTWLLHTVQSRAVRLPLRVYRDAAAALLRRDDAAAALLVVDYGLTELSAQGEGTAGAASRAFAADVLRLLGRCLQRVRGRERSAKEEGEMMHEEVAGPQGNSRGDDEGEATGRQDVPASLASVLRVLHAALGVLRSAGLAPNDAEALLQCMRALRGQQNELCARHLPAWVTLLHEVTGAVSVYAHHHHNHCSSPNDGGCAAVCTCDELVLRCAQRARERALRYVLLTPDAAGRTLGGEDVLVMCEDAVATMTRLQVRGPQWTLLADVLPLCCGVCVSEAMHESTTTAHQSVRAPLLPRCRTLLHATCAGLSCAGEMAREALRCATRCTAILQLASTRLGPDALGTKCEPCEEARALLRLSLGALRQRTAAVHEADVLLGLPCVTGNELPWRLTPLLRRRPATMSDTAHNALVQAATHWLRRMTGGPHFRLGDALVVVHGLLCVSPSRCSRRTATALCDALLTCAASCTHVARAECDAGEETLRRLSHAFDGTATQTAADHTTRLAPFEGDRATLPMLAVLLLYAAPQEQLQLVQHYCGNRLSLWQVATWLVQHDALKEEEEMEEGGEGRGVRLAQALVPPHAGREEEVVSILSRQYLLHTRLALQEYEADVSEVAGAVRSGGAVQDTHRSMSSSSLHTRALSSSASTAGSRGRDEGVQSVFHGLLDAATAAAVMAAARPAVHALRDQPRWSVVAEAELRQSVFAQRRGRAAVRLTATAPSHSRRRVAQYWHVHHARLAPELTLRLPELLCLVHYAPRLRAMATQYGGLSHAACEAAVAELAAEVQLRHFCFPTQMKDARRASLWRRPRTARTISLLFQRLYDTLLRLDAQPAAAQVGRAEFMRSYGGGDGGEGDEANAVRTAPLHGLTCRTDLIAHTLRLRRRVVGGTAMRLPWSTLSAIVRGCGMDAACDSAADRETMDGSVRRVTAVLEAADVPEWQRRLAAAMTCEPRSRGNVRPCDDTKAVVGRETRQTARQAEDAECTLAHLIADIRTPALRALMRATYVLLQAGASVPATASLALLECYQHAIAAGGTRRVGSTGVDVPCEDLLCVWRVMTRGRWLARLQQPAHGAAMRRLVCPSSASLQHGPATPASPMTQHKPRHTNTLSDVKR